MPLTIAICDDNEDQIKELRRLLGEWSSDKPFALNIDEYISAESFLFSYADKPCDLILLDIEMKKLNGMELARKLRAKNDMLPIIFITGYSDYISEGYDVEALHYLIKPVSDSKLFNVLDKFTQKIAATEQIVLSCDSEIIRISPDNITYIEAKGRKTAVYLSAGKTLNCNMSISRFADMTLQGFVRCHRSYLVNLRFLKIVGKTEITLDNGGTVPISRREYDNVNRAFIEFYVR